MLASSRHKAGSNQRLEPEKLKMKCPKCGHEWPNKNQSKGGKARWKGTTKKQRSKAASDAAKARWIRLQNTEISRREADSDAKGTHE